MRLLVTGATGFLGQALTRRLLADGHSVRAACRRRPDPVTGFEIAPDPGIDWQPVGEIGPDTPWQPALAGVEAVVHLAARVHVLRRENADALALYRRVNTDSTLALARAAVAAGVRRFVFVSSIKAIAGDRSPVRLTETTPPAPDSPYGVSKLEAEQGLARLGAETGLEPVVLRPPLVFGPGVKGNFRRLLRLCDSALPLPLGGLDNRRSLLALDNLVDALALCLTHPDAAGRTFHIADQPSLSTTELVRRLRHHLQRRPGLVRLPAPLLAGATRLVPGARRAWDRLAGSLELDAGLIRTSLGWTPPVGLDEALAATVAWYRAQTAAT